MYPGNKMAVVAEAPGEEEVELGRPLIGRSGQEAMQGLMTVGVNRNHTNWTNAVLCRPPGNDWAKLMLRLKKENKRLEEAGEQPYLNPIDACRPRLVAELRTTPHVIAMGKTALTALTGLNKSILEVRGMPVSGQLDGEGGFHGDLYIQKSPMELVTPLRVMPVLHPAFILRSNRWRRVFRVDLSRAVRWFNGTLTWREPLRIHNPSPQQLADFILRTKHKFLLYDVETDAKECLTANLRCIGIGTPDVVMVAGLLGIDGSTHFYTEGEEEQVKEIFRECFLRPDILKAGHNVNYYDKIVIEQRLGVTPKPTIDTIMLHRAAESELPHNLGFVGSMFTDVLEAWKAAHTATTTQTDHDLWMYNGNDVVINARCVEPLYKIVEARGLLPVVAIHQDLQDVCAGMHRNGLYVDQEARRKHDVRLKREAAVQRQTLRQILGNEDFNPNSRDQVAEVLFSKWGLTPDVIYAADPSAGKKIKKAYTASGSPSTGDDHLRAMMIFVRSESQKAFLHALRKFRRAVKLRGTNIIPLRPVNEPYQDDDLAVDLSDPDSARRVDEDDGEGGDALDGKGPTRQKREKKAKAKILKPGLTLLDGRVHPHFNAHAATSQRFSSSEPNAQNQPRGIRDMFCAEVIDAFNTGNGWQTDSEGYRWPREFKRAFIGADQDALELKVVAALAKMTKYLEVFDKQLRMQKEGRDEDYIKANGGDPHTVTCETLYGDAFRQSSASDKKRMRDFAKRFTYATVYKATVETIHETLASTENEAGELVFPWLTLKETRLMFARFTKGMPEIEAWWDWTINYYREHNCLIEPVFGWRRDFLDGEDPNELINFRAQAGGAAIVHIATLKYLKEVPFERWGPGTGLVQQGHDALISEVPATHSPFKVKGGKVKQWCPPGCNCVTAQQVELMSQCMYVDGRPFGMDVTFTGNARAMFRWSDM